jgi:(S)-sulfolactate dehydrogenase
MAEIVISEFMDDAAVARLAARTSTFYAPDLVDRVADLRAELMDARALIVRNRTQVNAALLEAAPKLTCVGRLGVGLDNINIQACDARGIAVHAATGANDDAVAEYVVSAALILLRPALLWSVSVASGAWPRDIAIGREISGKRAGLIGFGRTARKTAERLQALGMEICAYDPMQADEVMRLARVFPVPFEELLAESDLVSLHIPLTPTTKYLIDSKALARMKPGSVIVNAARGGIIDEAALCGSLRSGALSGAAIDVFENEPLDAEHGAQFEGVPNLLLTPHIAGVTLESNKRVSALIADLVLKALDLTG